MNNFATTYDQISSLLSLFKFNINLSLDMVEERNISKGHKLIEKGKSPINNISIPSR